MLCYDCSLSGAEVQAIGMCHHCSAGLCSAHAHVDPEPVRVIRRNPVYSTVKETVNLPANARRLLCRVCQQALKDRRTSDVVAVSY